MKVEVCLHFFFTQPANMAGTYTHIQTYSDFFFVTDLFPHTFFASIVTY